MVTSSLEPSLLGAGTALMLLAALVLVLVVALPNRRVDVRRRLQADPSAGRVLAHTASGATSLVTRLVDESTRAQRWAYTLDRAGIRRPLPEVLIIEASALMAGSAVGFVIGGPLLALLAAAIVVLVSVVIVVFRAGRRRRQFTDQLDDVLQLLATNLRAGHSLLQSIDSLTSDTEEPARSELARVVNQVRVGRDLGDAIHETSLRMDSEDFTWVAQAIGIHRHVGGNLADVLDTVSLTIRERNQVRRQVRSLSAEGRLSAVILMGIPVIVTVVLSILNPIYFRTFTQSGAGFAMLGTCVLLMTLGGLWLWRLIRVEY